MKNMKLSNGMTGLKRVIALLLVLMMLVAAIGCDGDDKQGTSSGNLSSNQSSSQNDSSPDASLDDSSEETSDEESSSAPTGTTGKIDPLKGDINVEFEYKSGSRADANEITPAVDPAGYNKGFVGYAEKERLERRNEILNTPNTEKLYDIKGTKFYVSTKGSDTNDGLSPETAIQSLAAIDTLTIQAGDAVLFERGCIWRLTETLELKSGVIYGSYGKGAKPTFFGSPKNFAQENWKPSNKKNVWQMNYMYAPPGGMHFNEGKEIGYLKLGLRDLKKNTDFYLNEETATLYLYCDDGNPSEKWEFIETSQQGVSIKAQNSSRGTIVDNFRVRYMGIHSIHSSYAAKNFTVTNCEIGYNGGGGNATKGGTRYGNSIESWCGGYGFTTNHNWIYQNFDTAISPQGSTGNRYGNYENQSISDNLFEYNNCDIESWHRDDDGIGNALYINCKYDNNIHRFTNHGWGTRADDGGIRGIDGVQYGGFKVGQVKSISWSNNIIDCPGMQVFKLGINDYNSYKNFVRNGNVYHFKKSLRRNNTIVASTFYWASEDAKPIGSYTASKESEIIKVFKEIEPSAKVYWHNE